MTTNFSTGTPTNHASTTNTASNPTDINAATNQTLTKEKAIALNHRLSGFLHQATWAADHKTGSQPSIVIS